VVAGSSSLIESRPPTLPLLLLPLLLLLLPLLLPSWELAAPNGFLTTTVITYVIWPTFLKERGPSATLGLQVPTVLLTHTGNTIIILAEMVLGRAPICVSHAGFAPLMGVAYIAFSWACNPFLAPKFGAQYL
jgi:hypothetical protein